MLSRFFSKPQDEPPVVPEPTPRKSWWPQDVDLPEKIGRGVYVTEDGLRDATTHFAYALSDDTPCQAMCTLEHYTLVLAFRRAACLIADRDMDEGGILHLNDEVLTDEQLLLCYAGAWAYCGYSISGFPEAARLGLKLRRKYG